MEESVIRIACGIVLGLREFIGVRRYLNLGWCRGFIERVEEAVRL